MTINSNFITPLMMACFTALILASCESHEQKTDAAYERVKVEKLASKDTVDIGMPVIEEEKKTFPVKKIEVVDEWIKFKLETEKKIIANENKIKEIKSIPNANTKLLKKAAHLEKGNNDLRRQMNEYNEEVKVKWESFKTAVNHNVNEISIELKDIASSNKK